MARINSQDFDESITFCGRGEEKNNFLMELYLKNEHDRNVMFNVFDENVKNFNTKIDSAYKSKTKFYEDKKESAKWGDDFDKYAKAMLQFFHYSKKELYPVVHRMRSGENIEQDLPADFYNYRKEIDFNNKEFTNFSPFVRYLSNMMNNLSAKEKWSNATPVDRAYNSNIKKLHIADSIFKNEKIKNTVLDNIAFTYLLEDQNIINNKRFLDKYYSLSTDKTQQNDIKKIGDAIQMLKQDNPLPDVSLVSLDNKVEPIKSIINKKTVIFFWTKNLESHFISAHKRVMDLKKKHPDYDFISVCVDEGQTKWQNMLKNYKFDGIREYRVTNFEEVKSSWVVNKIHRTMIVNADGTINNAFVSLFDVNFETNLK